MSNIKVCTKIDKPASQVFSKFGDGLFEKLVPSFARVLRNDGIYKGSKVIVKFLVPFMDNWHSEIIDVWSSDRCYYFTDIGLSGMPFGILEWKHTHKVIKINQVSCFIVDEIEFKTGHWLGDFIVNQIFSASMKMRRGQYKRFFK